MRRVLHSHHGWSCYQSEHNQIVYSAALREETERALSSDCAPNMIKASELDELVRMVPKPPNAITWEQGAKILDYVQRTLIPAIEKANR